jgi:Fe-S-cluster-containing dehydrogenase component
VPIVRETDEQQQRQQQQQQDGLSRRGFLTGTGILAGATLAGAALAGAALAGCAPKGDGSASGNVRQAKGHVNHVSDICSGCRTCELTCSVYNEGVVNPQLARNAVRKDIYVGHITEVWYCQQCDDPKCLPVCPTGALHADETTGARTIDQDVCIGCQSCLKACIFAPQSPRIKYNPVTQKCFKCDLCGGDPQCVNLCPLGASQLSWETYVIRKPGDDYVLVEHEGALDVEIEKQLTGHYASHLIMRDWWVVTTNTGVEVCGSWDSGEGSSFKVQFHCEFFDAQGGLLGQSEEHVYKEDLHEVMDTVHPFTIDDPSLIAKVVLVGEVTNWRNEIDEEY